MSQLFYGGNLLEKENIMSKRASTSYNNKFSNIIHTISYDSSKSQNVGTYSFKSAIAKTHSDIDFFEIMVVSALDLDMACKKLVKQLQEIVQKINKNKTFYFTELKCGYDTRYLIPEFGSFEKDKIVGHNKNKVEEKLIQLFRDKLLDIDDFQSLKRFNINMKTLKDLENVKAILHEYVTIRWNIVSDIRKGCQTIKGKKFYLWEMLKFPGIVKIDAITLFDKNRYIEVSNFIILKYFNKAGEELNINVPKNMSVSEYLEESIKKEISVLSNPNSIKKNYFKVAKRVFALASVKNDKIMIKKFYLY
jgi:hypothetical protein